jgi:tetrahydromethanopterin S-methyltransferase subunit G
MTDPETNRRFDRLEVKIDKLTEVLTNVARVEEKLIGTDARLKRHEYRLDENEKKIEEVEGEVRTNSQVVKVGQGIAASIWAALVGAIVYMFRD